ncbi:hypothetical protein, partial [Salmonella enterica]|uniref:hypothetical protein n=1 Tax=Salmonella enterica TaxID=28901 RepID=UPI001C7037A3
PVAGRIAWKLYMELVGITSGAGFEVSSHVLHLLMTALSILQDARAALCFDGLNPSITCDSLV